MIGKYELEITTRRVDYKLTLERNITILRGNSALVNQHYTER